MLTKQELKSLNEHALQTNEPPGYVDTDPVQIKGEPLSDPVHWTGRQWAVTSHGIEARDGKYHIAGKRAWEMSGTHGWIEHMAEKEWVDIQDFPPASE